MTLEAFRDKLVMKTPLANLTEVLAEFLLFQKVQDSPEVLDRVAYEVVHDCYREGTRKLELRFSPSFVAEHSGMRWEDVLAGFESGMKRAVAELSGMRAGLICIATRDYGVADVARVVDFYLQNRAHFIGVDLAGNEVDYPCRMFADAFRKAKSAGARITIHAGEAVGPENIWEAIRELGAERIGHGITAAQDPRLMEYLAKHEICLEICPTSNWLTQATPDLAHHPLPGLLRAGVPVGINTDDPGIFGVTVPHEVEVCRTRMGMTAAEVARCFEHAERASFLQ
jgi:adenosine deaminase